MARKRKTSEFEVALDLVSALPWWVGVAVAVIGYFVLHKLATPIHFMPNQQGQDSTLVARMMISGLASAGQYIVPLIGLIGAGISFVRRKQRAALLSEVVHKKSASALDGISWHQFELLVGEAYRLQGYSISETGGGGADGGVDLILRKGGEKFFVQCKQWKAFKVGVNVVRELYGVMAAEGATGGFVVTSGRFTDDAQKFASGRNIKLVDGSELFATLTQLKRASKVEPPLPAAKAQLQTPHTTEALTCPRCSSAMIKRFASKGENAGQAFWGCSKFPTCRGVRAFQ
jgi:restriction system protein